MSRIKSIKQVGTGRDLSLQNKTVLVRCDFDLPLKRQRGKIIIKDDSRLRACLSTIEYLLKKKARIILIGHLGRPGGKVVPELSLAPVKERLEKLLKKDLRFKNYDPSASFRTGLRIKFIKNFTGYGLRVTGYNIAMLENLRFWPGEENNDKKFAKKLAGLADIYVNEAFAVSHREAASVAAIQNYLPSYAGLHLEEEIKSLSSVMQNPKHPLVLIIGGAKIETKLPVIKNFLNKADYILVGGAVANDFIKAMGFEVGKSVVDERYLAETRFILKKSQILNHKFQINLKLKIQKLFKNASSAGIPQNCGMIAKAIKIKNYKIILPIDVKVADSQRLTINKKISEVNKNERILDIGAQTIKLYCAIIKKAKTIVWNGPMGYFEERKFAIGTYKVAKNVLKSRARVVIGGGETGEAIKKSKINPPAGGQKSKIRKNVFVSTGGGAMLEYLAGKKLPGLKGLVKNNHE